MIKLVTIRVVAAALVSLRAAGIRSPAPGCFQVSYADWTTGGEGRQFYEPLPKLLDLRLIVDSLAAKDSTLIGYRAPVGPEGGSRVTWRRPDSRTWSIRVPRGWSAGLVLRVTATSSSDTLMGSLTDYADYQPRTTLTARVRLVRTSCRPT